MSRIFRAHQPLENAMVLGDYYAEPKPPREEEYDPYTDPNWGQHATHEGTSDLTRFWAEHFGQMRLTQGG